MRYPQISFWVLILIGTLSLSSSNGEKPSLKLGLLKYNGGGDWYANPTALPNLDLAFCTEYLMQVGL